MTAQAPHILINDHPAVSFDGLHLYGVVTGNPDEPDSMKPCLYLATPDQQRAQASTTNYWKGYVPVLRLRDNGRLSLDGFQYSDGDCDEGVDEILEGDFFLSMRRDFYDLQHTVLVPFKGGRIVASTQEWIFPKKRILLW